MYNSYSFNKPTICQKTFFTSPALLCRRVDPGTQLALYIQAPMSNVAEFYTEYLEKSIKKWISFSIDAIAF
jgi:hypothetical protein